MQCASNRSGGVGLGASVVFVLALALVPPVKAGEAHRWVDEHGGVHYGDAPPPDSVRSSHRDAAAAVDAETVATTDAAVEAEEAERARHDRMLLRSYTTVDDLERTRDRRLGGVDVRIGLATHKVRRARRRAEGFAQALQDLPENDVNRAVLESALATEQGRLERAREALSELEATRAQMADSFAADIARFRELTADED